MFEPSYTLLALLIVRRFVFPEAVMILALLRLILGKGWVRLPAAAAFLTAGAMVATVFAPAMGLAHGAAYITAARWMQTGGPALLLVPVGFLLVGALSRRRPWPWVEIVLVGVTLGFCALWIAAQF